LNPTHLTVTIIIIIIIMDERWFLVGKHVALTLPF